MLLWLTMCSDMYCHFTRLIMVKICANYHFNSWIAVNYVKLFQSKT